MKGWSTSCGRRAAQREGGVLLDTCCIPAVEQPLAGHLRPAGGWSGQQAFLTAMPPGARHQPPPCSRLPGGVCSALLTCAEPQMKGRNW